MALRRMPDARQEEVCIAASSVEAVDMDKLLRKSGFDEFAWETCREPDGRLY